MFLSPCLWCKHFDATAHEKHIGWRCPAFPEEIPPEINSGGGFLHTEPYPGDNGIQFERQDDSELTRSLADVLEVSLLDSATLLQMMIDMVVEGVNWNYYPGRYPTKWDKGDE